MLMGPSEKPKKAKFADLQDSQAHLAFVNNENFVWGAAII